MVWTRRILIVGLLLLAQTGIIIAYHVLLGGGAASTATAQPTSPSTNNDKIPADPVPVVVTQAAKTGEVMLTAAPTVAESTVVSSTSLPDPQPLPPPEPLLESRAVSAPSPAGASGAIVPVAVANPPVAPTAQGTAASVPVPPLAQEVDAGAKAPVAEPSPVPVPPSAPGSGNVSVSPPPPPPTPPAVQPIPSEAPPSAQATEPPPPPPTAAPNTPTPANQVPPPPQSPAPLPPATVPVTSTPAPPPATSDVLLPGAPKEGAPIPPIKPPAPDQPPELPPCPWTLRMEIVKGHTELEARIGTEVQFRVICESLEMQAPRGCLQAKGDVKITGSDLDGHCQSMTINWQDDHVLLEGHARVKCLRDGQDVELTGERLSLRLSTSSSVKGTGAKKVDATSAGSAKGNGSKKSSLQNMPGEEETQELKVWP